jgi:hypothetical protein
MAQLSTVLKNALIDHVFRNTAYVPPATCYLALYTSDPAVDDSGVEVSGGAYVRQAITFGAAAGGVIANDALLTYPTALAPWGNVTHWGIKDAVGVGGVLMAFGQFTTALNIDTGETDYVNIGDVELTFNAQISDYLANILLDFAFSNVAYVPPAAVYIGLYSTDPLGDDSGTEATAGGSYARQAMTFIAPTDGITSNDPVATFPTITAPAWGTIGWFAIKDAVGGGANQLCRGALDVARVTAINQTLKFPIGSIILTMS